MECKLELDPDNKSLTGRNNRSSFKICSHAGTKCVLGFLIALNFVFIASVFYLQIDNLKLWKNIDAQNKNIERVERHVDEKYRTRDHSEHAEQLTLHKRNDDESNANGGRRQRRNRLGRRRNHRRRDVANNNLLQSILTRLKCLILKPIVHLNAKSNSNDHGKFSRKPGCHLKCFTWEEPDDSYEPNFMYITDTSGAETLVTGIKILTSGTYEVYSQVVLNGPQVNSAQVAVGYETVKISRGSQAEVLMESYLTQDNRGGQYYGLRGTAYPVDVLSHMGMFKLNHDDIIVVRPKRNNQNADFLPIVNRAYFGLRMVNYETNYMESVLRGELRCSRSG